jgi:transcription antitermination factor NusG
MSEMCERVHDEIDRSKPELQWFAAYTASHHEKRVVEQLTLRRVETFLPAYKESRQWSKRKPVDLTLPLFPNYIFVRTTRSQRAAVLGTPGVFSIVGSSDKAWALPDREIEALRNSLHERVVRPHPYLVVGERARSSLTDASTGSTCIRVAPCRGSLLSSVPIGQ